MSTVTIEGERRRDQNLAVVSARRPAQVWAAQLSMLLAMRGRADQTGSSDDMTPAGVEHTGNAPWIGAAVAQLRSEGLIAKVGHIVSTRKSRNANEIKLWKLVDAGAADAAIDRLHRILDALKPRAVPSDGTLFGTGAKV
jgi:hypothetical protein